jgi:hypothetical protein
MSGGEPAHHKVQTVSGSGFSSGSRVPVSPAAISATISAKERALSHGAGVVGTLPRRVPTAAKRRIGASGKTSSTRKLAATASVPPQSA